MEKIKLNTIEEAIEDFRKGEFVIIVDDEDRVSPYHVARNWIYRIRYPTILLY